MHFLIASVVRDRPEVLRHFLRSLSSLDLGEHTVRYAFIDGSFGDTFTGAAGERQEASDMLAGWAAFADPRQAAVVLSHAYRTVEKDRLLQLALNMTDFHVDAVLMVDSDLVLHPDTLRHLAGLGLPIVSEVFWTAWTAGQPLPNVWSRHEYTHDEGLLADLKKPGTYRVGGLCGCTLIRRDAIERGVRFGRIDNLPNEWDEARHFSVRARALGLELWASTYNPPVHLYRPEDVAAFEARTP